VKKNGNSLLEAGEGELQVRALLGAGGSVPPEKLLEQFLGRKPSNDAFLKTLGFS